MLLEARPDVAVMELLVSHVSDGEVHLLGHQVNLERERRGLVEDVLLHKLASDRAVRDRPGPEVVAVAFPVINVSDM